jgi:hypothetical protein
MLMRPRENLLFVPEQEECVESVGDMGMIDLPCLRDFAGIWQECRRNNGFPSRKSLDPSRFPALLSHLYVLDREPPPVHWRYRLAGAEIHTSLQRVSVKGCAINEVIPVPSSHFVIRRWAPVAERGVGIYMDGAIYRDADSFRTGGRLLLPLSESQDQRVTGLVGVSIRDRYEPGQATTSTLRIRHIRL